MLHYCTSPQNARRLSVRRNSASGSSLQPPALWPLHGRGANLTRKSFSGKNPLCVKGDLSQNGGARGRLAVRVWGRSSEKKRVFIAEHAARANHDDEARVGSTPVPRSRSRLTWGQHNQETDEVAPVVQGVVDVARGPGSSPIAPAKGRLRAHVPRVAAMASSSDRTWPGL